MLCNHFGILGKKRLVSILNYVSHKFDIQIPKSYEIRTEQTRGSTKKKEKGRKVLNPKKPGNQFVTASGEFRSFNNFSQNDFDRFKYFMYNGHYLSGAGKKETTLPSFIEKLIYFELKTMIESDINIHYSTILEIANNCLKENQVSVEKELTESWVSSYKTRYFPQLKFKTKQNKTQNRYIKDEYILGYYVSLSKFLNGATLEESNTNHQTVHPVSPGVSNSNLIKKENIINIDTTSHNKYGAGRALGISNNQSNMKMPQLPSVKMIATICANGTAIPLLLFCCSSKNWEKNKSSFGLESYLSTNIKNSDLEIYFVDESKEKFEKPNANEKSKEKFEKPNEKSKVNLFSFWAKIFVQYLEKTRGKGTNRDQVFVALDNGDGQRIDFTTIEYLYQNGVILFYFIGSTTHLFQPLDLILFMNFKRILHDTLNKISGKHSYINLKAQIIIMADCFLQCATKKKH